MKRLIVLIFLLAVGFYVAWPAWSGYQIKSALDAGDAATLRHKIDFVSVRQSLRPAATHHAEKMLTETLQAGGPVSTVLDDQTKATLLPKIVDSTLDQVVTPENLIRIASQGGAIKDTITKIVKEQMGGSLGGIAGLGKLKGLKIGGGDGGGGDGVEIDIGGLVGGIVGGATNNKGLGELFGGDDEPEPAAPTPQPAAQPEAKTKKPKYGLNNIKSFGFAGPLGLQVGVAKDAKAKLPDVTAEMGFRGMDWKLVGLHPRF
ncbi:MAG: DUF2939 domain-containing protein [Alphaproteobacteria bacterium]|nr:DUF2939 domain-containing protein [Alphaproteobacteria bacterium]